jgi:hypothetical protein
MKLSVRAFVALSILLAAILIPMSVNTQQQPVRHVVVFKYKPSATPEQIQQVTQAFRELKKKIPGMTAFEDGVNNSPEKLNKGFTHVYVMTFESAAARDAYLPHPEHKAFGALLGKLGVLEEAFVVDYAPTAAK